MTKPSAGHTKTASILTMPEELSVPTSTDTGVIIQILSNLQEFTTAGVTS